MGKLGDLLLDAVIKAIKCLEALKPCNSMPGLLDVELGSFWSGLFRLQHLCTTGCCSSWATVMTSSARIASMMLGMMPRCIHPEVSILDVDHFDDQLT